MGSEASSIKFNDNLQRNGNPQLHDNVGLIPRFMDELFTSLVQRKDASEKEAILKSPSSKDDHDMQQQQQQQTQQQQAVSLVDFKVSASFLEVYGEDIYDLLDEDNDDRTNSLKIREDSNKEVIVVGLKCAPINNAFEAMNILNTGTMNRTTASTLMNLTSSRSHAVFTVHLQQTTRSYDGCCDELLTTTSRFTFVDLAGSERMKKTGAEGERAKEGIKINEGLLALGNVINALADEDRLAKGEKCHHVPYRQSKLTRLLQDALGGNSQTLFLACVSPSDTNASETLSTLHYANRARNIKNAPTRNVDAAAEELRRLRTLTNLLKCELIKERYDGGGSAVCTTSTDPETERGNGNDNNVEEQTKQDIGIVNEELLKRDDVIAYMQQIDQKVSELSGTTTSSNLMLSFPTQPSTLVQDGLTPRSFDNVPPTTSQVVSSDHPDTEEEDGDDSDIDDVNPDEDLQIIDELLETQHEEQIGKIDGEIEEQEEKLIHLKKHIKVYHDMKEKYEALTNEVQKLEDEKHALAEKLEKAQTAGGSGEGSSWIMSKLEEVKASLQRARQDVRKQQQKCREAELDAQRCKGLERRIEEMKSIKANLIKKQRDDAKRQKDFSKTKAREIQDLRRKERSASKKVLKLETECSRHKMAADASKTRYERLSKKLKQVEMELKQARSSRRGITTASTNNCRDGENEVSSAKINSVKYVLDKTVADRVGLTKDRILYKTKASLHQELKHKMAEEVRIVNDLKRKCETLNSKPSDDILDEILDHEDNMQDITLQLELVEQTLDELHAKHPSIENDNEEVVTGDNVFEEHEAALKMLSKLQAPVLRTLLLSFLGSCYKSEVSIQRVLCSLLLTHTYPNHTFGLLV